MSVDLQDLQYASSECSESIGQKSDLTLNTFFFIIDAIFFSKKNEGNRLMLTDKRWHAI